MIPGHVSRPLARPACSNEECGALVKLIQDRHGVNKLRDMSIVEGDIRAWPVFFELLQVGYVFRERMPG